MSVLRFVCGAFLLALVAGCTSRVDLYSNLQQREANEMMAILQDERIGVTKVAGEEGTWNLLVPTVEFSQSVESLKAQGYPRDVHSNMGELFQKSGLVSSPSETRIRYIHGKQEEIVETITRVIPGVLTARVHIVPPDDDPFKKGSDLEQGSVSVVLRHRHDAGDEISIPEISRIVAAALEGVSHEQVEVALHRAADPAKLLREKPDPEYVDVLSLRMAPDSVTRFWSLFGGVSGVATLNLALLIGAVFYRRRATTTSESG